MHARQELPQGGLRLLVPPQLGQGQVMAIAGEREVGVLRPGALELRRGGGGVAGVGGPGGLDQEEVGFDRGAGAVLHADGAHFWPYGLNYDYEQFNAKLRVNNLTGKRYDSYASYADWLPGGKGLYSANEEDVRLSLGYRF